MRVSGTRRFVGRRLEPLAALDDQLTGPLEDSEEGLRAPENVEPRAATTQRHEEKSSGKNAEKEQGRPARKSARKQRIPTPRRSRGGRTRHWPRAHAGWQGRHRYRIPALRAKRCRQFPRRRRNLSWRSPAHGTRTPNPPEAMPEPGRRRLLRSPAEVGGWPRTQRPLRQPSTQMGRSRCESSPEPPPAARRPQDAAQPGTPAASRARLPGPVDSRAAEQPEPPHR